MIRHTIIKRVNATEVGHTNTNDTYLLLPKGYQTWTNIFDSNMDFDVVDKRSDNMITLKFTNPREENRLTKLGKYYRDYNITSGDTIIIECVIDENRKTYYIDYIDNRNKVTLKKTSENLELYSEDVELFNTLVAIGMCQNFTFTEGPQIQRRNRSLKTLIITMNNEPIAIENEGLLEIECIPETDLIRVTKTRIFNYYKMEIDNG